MKLEDRKENPFIEPLLLGRDGFHSPTDEASDTLHEHARNGHTRRGMHEGVFCEFSIRRIYDELGLLRFLKSREYLESTVKPS